MSDYNPAYISMIEGLCLAPALNNYVSNRKEISTYPWFTGSIQWLAYQTYLDILLIVAKLIQNSIKPTDKYWTTVTCF